MRSREEGLDRLLFSMVGEGTTFQSSSLSMFDNKTWNPVLLHNVGWNTVVMALLGRAETLWVDGVSSNRNCGFLLGHWG
jgi:hypothetical protein